MHNCIGIFILTSYNNKEDRDEKNGKCAFCWCTGYDCTVLWRREKGYTLNGEISDVKDGMVYLKNIRINRS